MPMSIEENELQADASVALATQGGSIDRTHCLHWPQNHELAESSIPDLLTIVARNALIAIPAEQCVVFMYDKSTNLLTAQVACGGPLIRETPGANSKDNGIHRIHYDESQDDELSFPPVMGLVSACFLQRRCLRMQEPNLHKSFHREYDVPKHMTMNSIIAAPVTLHHRTVGVVELINRIDPDAPLELPEVLQHDTTFHGPLEHAGIAEEEHEIKLMRTKTVQQRARIGFSAKDEQKMIQFTSHVAQLLDNKLKLLAQIESAAKFRDEQATAALELLDMMNQKLEYRATGVAIEDEPHRLVKRKSSVTIVAVPVEWTPEQLTSTKTKGDTDDAHDDLLPFNEAHMLRVMIGISRTQAIFRGHHLRKVHRLSEALQQHRANRKRVKSALVIQRATRRFLAQQWRQQRRNAVWVIVRAVKSYQTRAALVQRMEIKKRQKRKRSVVIAVPPREGTHHKLVESDVHTFRERYASAIRIQQHYRGHKARKQIEKIVGFKDLTKGLKNIVKLQSILRGSIARKHVEKIREEKRATRAANVVCMRLAATDNHLGSPTNSIQQEPHRPPTSRNCLYPLPSLPTGAHIVSNRIVSWSTQVKEPEELTLHVQNPTPSPLPVMRRRRFVQASYQPSSAKSAPTPRWISPVSRPLAPSPLGCLRTCSDRPAPLIPVDTSQLTRTQLTRLHPEIVFEVDPKRAKRCPVGVQRADDWLPRRPAQSRSTRRSSRHEERDTDDLRTDVTELPRLIQPTSSIPQSNQLQVCFLPAANRRRSTIQPCNPQRPSIRPPTQPQTARPIQSSTVLQRPNTTR